ncbi:heme ABC exporter ATP-binding protein CcmA [Qipengyuania spongiae]|uniref:Heme ABC exporter ATP-binding protein CcmA n=1 Tax=Qipengyuania spongiae TaxID=2909673 RepID=A0ABY5T0Z8_9SPHN|nr:heme ABC exporter ATP-binding protein CcmA [Qipengyuania spongiae]UVI40470.1 heme ABC exporter ATP-binding protein CcmA [Qipengyuania spongiae]
MQPRLAATNLACRRGDRLLFRGLSLELGAGDALHVTGANGVGKSSLIRILAGLLRPFAGAIAREGRVALVDERLALDETVPLGTALGFWSRLDRSLPTLDRVGLADLADVPVRFLSTGQRKRAALARLLAAQAPIWLLDEPLNGLDDEGKRLVEGLISDHCADGGLCLAASHQPIALPDGKTLALRAFAA